MSSSELKYLPSNKAIILENITCIYCGCNLKDNSENTKEHVIGRRFVPKGSLDGWWNLILRACTKCNSIKSNLENDISAITLVWKTWLNSSNANESEIKEACRKSQNSISNKTRKPVIKSKEKLKIEISNIPGLNLAFNTVAPPQLDEMRIYDLARLQLMAFFYFITYDETLKRGYYWEDGFHPLAFALHSDWGNELQKSFMEEVVNWEPRFVCDTANGYFKLIIRKHPDAKCWSWAIEWNKSCRVVGFFGSREVAQKFVDNFIPSQLKWLKPRNDVDIGFRSEVKLYSEDDILFKC